MWSLCESENPFQMPFDTVVDLSSVDMCSLEMRNRIQVEMDI